MCYVGLTWHYLGQVWRLLMGVKNVESGKGGKWAQQVLWWLTVDKSKLELETVNQLAKNVAKAVNVTSDEGFLVYAFITLMEQEHNVIVWVLLCILVHDIGQNVVSRFSWHFWRGRCWGKDQSAIVHVHWTWIFLCVWHEFNWLLCTRSYRTSCLAYCKF